MMLTKRVFAILLSVLMVFGMNQIVFAENNDPTIIVDLVDAKPGESVEIGVSVANNPGIISMLLNVRYSEHLKLKKVENEEFLDEAFHNVEQLDSNPYVLSWGADLAPDDITTNGKIVTLTFEVSSSAPNGKLPVQIIYDNKDDAIFNFALETVDFLVENGGVNVKGTVVEEEKPDVSVPETDEDESPETSESETKEPEETEQEPPQMPEKVFEDVNDNDWFFGSVSKAYELGLMNGITENSFAPRNAVTRGMFVTVLHRMSGEPIVNYAMMFEDVNLDEYYSEAVRWAASEKIVNGMSDVLFAPNDKITREQIATMLHRYAKAMGKDVSVGENANILSFKDGQEVSQYAIEAVTWVCGSRVMNGNADGTFAPRNNATRAELATVLVRAAEMLK